MALTLPVRSPATTREPCSDVRQEKGLPHVGGPDRAEQQLRGARRSRGVSERPKRMEIRRSRNQAASGVTASADLEATVTVRPKAPEVTLSSASSCLESAATIAVPNPPPRIGLVVL